MCGEEHSSRSWSLSTIYLPPLKWKGQGLPLPRSLLFISVENGAGTGSLFIADHVSAGWVSALDARTCGAGAGGVSSVPCLIISVLSWSSSERPDFGYYAPLIRSRLIDSVFGFCIRRAWSLDSDSLLWGESVCLDQREDTSLLRGPTEFLKTLAAGALTLNVPS